jgi:hypothetical protein
MYLINGVDWSASRLNVFVRPAQLSLNPNRRGQAQEKLDAHLAPHTPSGMETGEMLDTPLSESVRLIHRLSACGTLVWLHTVIPCVVMCIHAYCEYIVYCVLCYRCCYLHNIHEA